MTRVRKVGLPFQKQLKQTLINRWGKIYMYHSYWMYILMKCGKFPTFNFNFFFSRWQWVSDREHFSKQFWRLLSLNGSLVEQKLGQLGAIASWHYKMKLHYTTLLIIDSKTICNSDRASAYTVYMSDCIKYMIVVFSHHFKVASLSHYKPDVYVNMMNNITFYE